MYVGIYSHSDPGKLDSFPTGPQMATDVGHLCIFALRLCVFAQMWAIQISPCEN